MSHANQFIDPVPIETCPGLFEVEINTMDVKFFPDAWKRDNSGLYIYKPGLKGSAEDINFTSHEAGALFGELVRFLLKASGNENQHRMSLGNWGEVRNDPRDEYRIMYLVGVDAAEEIISEESLGTKMTPRRLELLETHLFFLALNAEEAARQKNTHR